MKQAIMYLILCLSALNVTAWATPSKNTQCFASGEDKNQAIYFFTHYLGQFDVHLNPTLNAIRSGQANNEPPYYKKPWRGKISNLCPQGGCIEWTVYPNKINFTDIKDPNINIEDLIRKYTRIDNRGETRIITNAQQTKYIYTTDHESTFCGPYSLK